MTIKGEIRDIIGIAHIVEVSQRNAYDIRLRRGYGRFNRGIIVLGKTEIQNLVLDPVFSQCPCDVCQADGENRIGKRFNIR